MRADNATIDLAQELIRIPSITPNDHGCIELLAKHLEPHGFNTEIIEIEDVKNVLFTHGDKDDPLFIFLGHTDVVPVGRIEQWSHPPFAAHIEGDLLYGRGTADMKGSIAAFVIAAKAFVEQNKHHKKRIGILLTSDEEGPADHGIRAIAPLLHARGDQIEMCLVGEPSSSQRVGDTIKNGRRGSLGAELVIHGKQGHVAYPHLAQNPIHLVAPALAELVSIKWDNGNAFFPPTSFQISNINSGTGATNVIPGDCEIVFNFRYSTETTHEELKTKVEAILNSYGLNFDIKWKLNGEPFLTDHGELVDATQKAIQSICGYATELSTSGGTSDGRFIAPFGAQVLELGPLNTTIHQVNECVSCSDLITLEAIYLRIMNELLK